VPTIQHARGGFLGAGTCIPLAAGAIAVAPKLFAENSIREEIDIHSL